ncbi:MAG: 16S rRNA (guanine(527)-N(7))-methyltransferase RsmG [Deltaproteobacteria bacterium]|nr:16S rRNA (guanine(527)-N(7))-methyltransferase RsmG [Deltaproteobacteria bacterium]
MTDEAKKILTEGALELGVSLDESKNKHFETFLGELQKWNEKMNLTSITEEKEIITRHFLDSLTPMRFLDGIEKILDIGSGAGFPGIPMKIAAPAIGITLMESTEKKVLFLRHIIRTLVLPNAQTVFARAEDKGVIDMLKENFGCVISRALTGIDEFLTLAAPYVRKNGMAIAMKGPTKGPGGEELKKELSGRKHELHEVKIPFTDRTTSIIIFHAPF